jgi:hypothetical protein
MSIGLVTASLAKSGDPVGGDQNRMAIKVYDYAQLEPRILRRAETIAVEVFAQAGIQVVFLEDGPAPDDPARDATLGSVPRFTVSILTPERTRAFGVAANVLGGAPGSPTDANRNIVYIFDQVASQLAEMQPNVGKARILGHAIAHEIGHLLLNMSRHSETGLMRADWKPEDMQAMNLGKLTFDAGQVAKIGKEVGRRIRQKASVGTAALR